MSGRPSETSKFCNKCGQSKPFVDFYKNHGRYDGVGSCCKTCTKAGLRARSRLIRLQALQAYGGPRCVCCNETHLEFLVLDHINGGGNKHRREMGNVNGGANFYRVLKRMGYPPGLRVLCQNCNQAFGAYRKCPHQVGSENVGLDAIQKVVANVRTS